MKEKVVILVVVKKFKPLRSTGDELEEMRELVYSCNGNVMESVVAKIDKPSPNYYVRQGKLDEIKELSVSCKANVLCVNIDLAPGQSRNIEKYLGIKVVDRTGLILDIFAKRAKSADGKLQVELAQYTYLLPRLSAIWEKHSRLGGGIGTRGPGEQILERDKRKIGKHITRLNRELEKVRKHRELVRKSRKRKAFSVVSIVGYTNAGKSTFLKKITGADIIVKDKLFATLDPVTRKYRMKNGSEVLFSDTVGFLMDLPHDLIKAFHSTLEEINEADLILIILDVSNQEYLLHYGVVQSILKDIKALGCPQIIVFNKIDKVSEDVLQRAYHDFSEAKFISAFTGDGVDGLMRKITKFLGMDDES